MQRFDILYLSDLRLTADDVHTALSAQCRALAGAGYSVGLLSLWSPAAQARRAVHPEVRSLWETGQLALVDPQRPIEARLAVACHPVLFAHQPQRRIRITCYRSLLLVPEGPEDGLGRPRFDPSVVLANANDLLGDDVKLVPVSPQVRNGMADVWTGDVIHEVDWAGVVDADLVGERSLLLETPSSIGRIGASDPSLWPDDPYQLLHAYPNGTDVAVRILGALPPMIDEMPANWTVVPASRQSEQSFLQSLDCYVYFHQSRHVEGYGYPVLKALAAGAVPILPSSFRAQLDGAAAYCRPKDVLRLVGEMRQDKKRVGRFREAAQAVLRERFSPEKHREDVRTLIGSPGTSRSRAIRRKRRVIFFSSNGVGLGHLTRQIAIARRCADWIEPVFVTMSQAVSILESFGFLCEYIPHHRHLPCDITQWNRSLANEVRELAAFYDARVLIFDGNAIYPGLEQALLGLPTCWRVWCRRAMWRAETGAASIERGQVFDLVLEPEDLAKQFDRGRTQRDRHRTQRVGPIRLLDQTEQLSREKARKELGLDEKGLAILVQLGSGNTRASHDFCEEICAYFEAQSDVQTRLLEWPISAGEGGPGLERLRTYPISRLLHAFDATVSAPGYNSFHDILAARLPSVFVPNENPIMDDQLARAHHAAVHGYGLVIRESDPYKVRDTLDQLLDPVSRRGLRSAALKFRVQNGAEDAARLLEQLVLTERCDQDHRDELLPALAAGAA